LLTAILHFNSKLAKDNQRIKNKKQFGVIKKEIDLLKQKKLATPIKEQRVFIRCKTRPVSKMGRV
jgi:hypothetical protein